ncbi:MAG TPA: NYN domain-containing protein, partial [Pyrinomonadaceae bacterium]|nr:NYN domain-containing protein [Pyrinomonadaceae bacterium]
MTATLLPPPNWRSFQAMPYLIDGNNLMAQRPGWHRDRAGARRRLLDDLAAYTAHKRVRLAVVFDGAPETHFADGASYRGVRVYYAERGSDADTRIKRFVEDSRERRTLLVVTSDRALGDYVRRTGARVLRSGEF